MELNEGNKHIFVKTYKNAFRCDNCDKEFTQLSSVFYCDEIDNLLCERCKNEKTK